MGNNISQEAKDIRKQYLKEWRKKNKEKVKLYNQTYWERKAQKIKNKKGDLT